MAPESFIQLKRMLCSLRMSGQLADSLGYVCLGPIKC